jgi:hypothetical protein
MLAQSLLRDGSEQPPRSSRFNTRASEKEAADDVRGGTTNSPTEETDDAPLPRR